MRVTRWLVWIALAGVAVAGREWLWADGPTAERPFAVREESAHLTVAPFVPPAIGRRVPTRTTVRLEAREKTLEIAPGVAYECWTFGGTVPGPMIRVFEGDTVDVEFANHPDNQRAYSIDFHAASGSEAGASSSETPPGKLSRISFKADHAGLYIYKASGTEGAEAVANGMAGLILVEPTYGFRRASREYYLMQSEFYTSGAQGEENVYALSMKKALAEAPDYVVFNGSQGSLTEDGALMARTGERVRLYVGNAGPNLSSSFHIVGAVFETVYYEGGSALNMDVATTGIPAGGTAIVEVVFDSPGDYEIVDHALFRSAFKGAKGLIRVKGEATSETAVSKVGMSDYEPPPPELETAVAGGGAMTPALQEIISQGEAVYSRTCIACHQADGRGIPFLYPPLAESDYLIADLDRAIVGVIKGQSGEMTVNGEKFNMLMPQQMLKDMEIAQVLTFVLNSFGNPGGEITVDRVKSVRAENP